MYIVSPINKTRRINSRTKGEFRKIEKYIMNERGTIDTVSISKECKIPRLKVSQELRRLHSLGVLVPMGKRNHDGRGRPVIIWERA